MSSSAEPTDPPTFFINLPTTSLPASTAFYTSLDFYHVKTWSDDKTAAFRLPSPNSSICLMLHTHPRMKEFMRPSASIADAHTTTEALFTVMCQTREEVDSWLSKAKEAGGVLDPYKLPGHGEEMGMYSRSWADLDGHVWEACAMVKPCE
ncbi:hypothetical protein MMYC01_208928 [Madurella mycetomatis]|uniref:VOC domain-containing protein n=1 Tax=Madurella mycetomatis TaxID=100816 RepID=A0A175VV88_9PEZI|nr:hypothetical protein MMYC01_208928 [Madurella mycetomatis]